MANGKGKLIKTSNKQTIYKGNWLTNLYHGQGFLINSNPKKFTKNFNFKDFNHLCRKWKSYEGDFTRGKWEGIGTLILTNGEKYVGKFMGGKIHETGNFKQLDGRVIAGIWKENILTY